MRDNSDTEDSTKINTQTQFQPIYTFILRSERAMIYDILNNFSKSLRGFWKFWNAGGLNFMTLTLLNPSQGSFFYDSGFDNELSANATDEEKIAAKRRKITYSEILTYALPTSLKVIEFKSLIDRVVLSQQQTSFMKRDDSATAEAMILLSDILNEHWQEFPLKVKVLLLDKLKVYRESFWQYVLASPSNTFKVIKSRIGYYIKFWYELKAYNNVDRRNIINKVSKNIELLKSAWNAMEETKLVIFESDGHLLEENRDNIDKFSHSIKTMIAARYLMKKHSKVLEELAK